MAEDSVVLLKKQASILREYLARVGIDLKQRNALEAVALMHGAKDWNTLLAQEKRGPRAAAEAPRDVSAPTSFGAFFEVESRPPGDTAWQGDNWVMTIVPLDTAAVTAGRSALHEILRPLGTTPLNKAPERICVELEPTLRSLAKRFPACLAVHLALGRCLHGQRKTLAAAYYLERVFLDVIALVTPQKSVLLPAENNQDLHELARALVAMAQEAQAKDWPQRATKHARLMLALWPQDDFGFGQALPGRDPVDTRSTQRRIKQ